MDQKATNMLQYCACSRLRAAARKITRAYEDALKPVGLIYGLFKLIFIRYQRPELSKLYLNSLSGCSFSIGPLSLGINPPD